MIRFAGRIEPGKGGSVFTGQSESSSLPASRNAMCMAPAEAPRRPRFGFGLVVSCAGTAGGALSTAVVSVGSSVGTDDPAPSGGRLSAAVAATAPRAGADPTAAESAESAAWADASPSAHAVKSEVNNATAAASRPSVRSDISGKRGEHGDEGVAL